MAKDKERDLAQILYVDQGLTAKEIAVKVGVSENTMTAWVNNGNWKDLRTAKLSATKVQVDNLKSIINDLATERLNLYQELNERTTNEERASQIRERMAKIDDSVSKWNKTLESVNKEGKISLKDTIIVVEDILKEMSAIDHNLYLRLVDFFQAYINNLAAKK